LFAMEEAKERKCDNCEDRSASVACALCDEVYCSWCDEILHRAPALRAHERHEFGDDRFSGAAPSKPSPPAAVSSGLSMLREKFAARGDKGDRKRFLTLGMGLKSENCEKNSTTQLITCKMNPVSGQSVMSTTCESSEEPLPNGCLTCITTAFVASESMDEGFLDGMFSQVLEGVLSEQEFYNKFETSVVPGPDCTLFCIKVYLGIDGFGKLAEMQKWTENVHAFSISGEMVSTFSDLIAEEETQVLSTVKVGKVSSTADVNIFDAESQESMPEAVRRALDMTVGTELAPTLAVLPVSATDVSLNLQLDLASVLAAMQDEIGEMGTTKHIRTLISEVPLVLLCQYVSDCNAPIGYDAETAH